MGLGLDVVGQGIEVTSDGVGPQSNPSFAQGAVHRTSGCCAAVLPAPQYEPEGGACCDDDEGGPCAEPDQHGG
jgi:hypothetical protein